MTLATSSSIHQTKQSIADRQAEIRRDAERTRLNISKATTPRDVLPEGVDDLTPALATVDEPRLRDHHEPWLGRVLARLVPA